MPAFGEAHGAGSSSAYHRSVAEYSTAIHGVIGRDVATGIPGVSVDASSTEVSGEFFKIPRGSWIVRWSGYLETQFQNLVAMRADRRATSRDLERLDWFRKQRQRLKNPLKASQVLKDFKARELRQKALAALEAYVQFIEKPSSRS